ncbi:adenylyl-sulfate kinase [Lentisphaera marina]|uniref:adenylyl-sulfate kinase n=1 Tax=Lentisphaera marina TaxID=1111041 RepID=UPI0023652F65|nr:adenylyl-sulfate kinase [Lentisphaera marina]MDD7986883.1 adenylyl-sulfate kinase [Lentisphaera marina]
MNNCLVISTSSLLAKVQNKGKYNFFDFSLDDLEQIITHAKSANLAILELDEDGFNSAPMKNAILALSLCRVSHIIFLCNDSLSSDQIQNHQNDFKENSSKLSFHESHFISDDPRQDKLQRLLEQLHIKAASNFIDLRFVVDQQANSTISGRVLSGSMRLNEELIILPTEKTTRIKKFINTDKKVAKAGDSLTLELEDELHIGPGDILARPNNLPRAGNELDITITWLSEQSWAEGNHRIIARHNGKELNAFIEKVYYTINIDTLHRNERKTLENCDFAKVKLTTSQNLFFDSFRSNRATGFIELLDPVTKTVLALGTIKGESRTAGAQGIKSSNIKYEEFNLSREDYENRNQHKGCVLWFTGLSGSGKSTVAKAVLARLHEMGKHVNCLDGDNVRHGLCSDLGFTADDRSENIRRIGELAKLFMENGNITICSFISPYQKDRDFVRSILADGRFYETFIDCDIEVCKQRDPKGLYKKALAGQINGFTGIDSPYEAPLDPELRLKSDTYPVKQLVDEVIKRLKEDGVI